MTITLLSMFVISCIKPGPTNFTPEQSFDLCFILRINGRRRETILGIYLQSLLKIATCLLIVSLNPGAFTKSFQQVSQVQLFLPTRVLTRCPYMLNSEPVVLYCLWVSRQCICAITCQFCIVTTLSIITPTL